MGKHTALINVLKEELIDCKDNIVMTLYDFYGAEDGDDASNSLSMLELLADELDSTGDFLYDLLSKSFAEWDTIIALNERGFSNNHRILDAILEFRTSVEVETEEENEQVGASS